LILDLHVHSVFSLDSATEVESYAQRVIELREEHELDGFALMEHNRLVGPDDCDLAGIAHEYGIVILSGVEVDTFWGHLLAYGMTAELWSRLQESGARKQEPVGLARTMAAQADMALVPAHPFRGWIGTGERCRELESILAIEGLNGANEKVENLAALDLARKLGLPATGGSDAHFLPELGKCVTRVPGTVRTMTDLVAAIRAGRIEPLTMEQTRR
jgi:hypothetical protein